MTQSPKIVILTGARISEESGLGTFWDEGGLWALHSIEDIATSEAFVRNPELVHDFYNIKRAQAAVAEPNAAHVAVAELENKYSTDVVIITQNVDNLDARAGAKNVLHMHGKLARDTLSCLRPPMDRALGDACG